MPETSMTLDSDALHVRPTLALGDGRFRGVVESYGPWCSRMIGKGATIVYQLYAKPEENNGLHVISEQRVIDYIA